MTTVDWFALGFAALALVLYVAMVLRLISDYQELQRIRRNRRLR